jgi:flavin reductase (DIM6/NTAB) family NADH-FMN oxidoreductase RutF
MSTSPGDLASPLPSFDARAFRDALGSFPTGVAIMTTVHEGKPVGLTCNSFSSVSLDPPLVLWSLRRESKSLHAFLGAAAFSINILAEDQTALSARFASGKFADKFDGVGCQDGLHGIPLIADCVARFECSPFAHHDAGDHVIFIGRVERFEHGRAEDPLVFHQGAYKMLTESLRELAIAQRIPPEALDEARMLVYGMLLRLACVRGEDCDFDAMDTLLAEMNTLCDPADMRERAGKAVQFFDLIAQAAHNEVLAILARSLSTLLHHTINAQLPPRVRPELAEARARILRSVRSRDPNAAVAAMEHYASVVRPSVPVELA